MYTAIKKNKVRILYLIILLALSTFFYMFYFNNTLPFTDGWGIYYAELVKKGLTPYKDFYYYLPPLNILIDYLIWAFSDGMFIIYRLFRVIERLLMISLIYWNLSKYFKVKYTFIATVFAAILGTSIVYDLLGDYNQTSELFVIVLCCLSIKYIESIGKKRNVTIFFIGFFIAALLLLKQSSGLASGLTFFIIFCIYSFIVKNKKFVKDVLIVLAGFSIPILLCLTYLVKNDALEKFIDQVFLGGSSSKGGIFEIVFGSIFSTLKYYPELTLFFIIAAIGIWLSLTFTDRNVKYKSKMLWLFLMLSFASAIFSSYNVQAVNLINFVIKYWYVTISALLIIIFSYFILNKIIKSDDFDAEIIVFCEVMIFGLIVLYRNTLNISLELNNTDFFSLISRQSLIIWFIIVIGLVFTILKLKENSQSHITSVTLFWLAGAFASFYAVNMASAKSLPATRTFFVGLPIVVVVLLNKGNGENKYKKIKNLLVIVIGIALCFLTSAQKFTNSYSWWGWTEESINEKTEVVDIDALRGFKLSAKQKNMYEQVNKLIIENSTEDSIVWGFPHIKIFNIITNRIGEAGSIPVPFYDVCGDKAAIQEAEKLKKNNPDIVIWCDMPGCIETHEEVFRDGKELGQRQIIKWFSKAKEKDYNLIGQVENLFIYKLKDGNPVKYTYFQDTEKVNETAELYSGDEQ